MLRPLTCDVKPNRRTETANGKLYVAMLSKNEEGEQEKFWEG